MLLNGIILSEVKSALMVIDVQLGLFTDRKPLYKAKELICNINLLIDSTRSVNYPDILIFFVQHSNKCNLIKGTGGYKYHPDIHLQEDDPIFYKTKPSVFEETDLHPFLQSKNVTQLFIAGLLSNACIKTNAIASHELGYNVILIHDAHSCLGSEEEGKKIVNDINKKLPAEGVVVLESTRGYVCDFLNLDMVKS